MAREVADGQRHGPGTARGDDAAATSAQCRRQRRQRPRRRRTRAHHARVAVRVPAPVAAATLILVEEAGHLAQLRLHQHAALSQVVQHLLKAHQLAPHLLQHVEKSERGHEREGVGRESVKLEEVLVNQLAPHLEGRLYAMRREQRVNACEALLGRGCAHAWVASSMIDVVYVVCWPREHAEVRLHQRVAALRVCADVLGRHRDNALAAAREHVRVPRLTAVPPHWTGRREARDCCGELWNSEH